MKKRIGDFVRAGDTVATIHARTEESARDAKKRIMDALTFTDTPCEKATLLYALIDRDGVHTL